MKAFIMVIVIVVTLSAAARDKKALVYDHIGEVVYAPIHYDSSAHLSTRYGNTDVYCNNYGNSIDCTDSPGGIRIVLQDDPEGVHATNVIFNRDEQISDECLLHATIPHICDPILRLAMRVLEVSHENMMAETSAAIAAIKNLSCGATKTCTIQEINEVDKKARAEFKKTPTTAKFQYRLATGAGGLSLYCVPFDVTDKKARVKQKETCYMK